MFDKLLDPDREDAYLPPGYGGRPETTNGQGPLCGELVAWRHPTFGNYTAGELAYSFVRSHDMNYSRELFYGFECLIWLLCDDANWLPQRIRITLLDGMKEKPFTWCSDTGHFSDEILNILIRRSRSKFRYTRAVRSALVESIGSALNEICVKEEPTDIAERFIAHEFIESYYDYQSRMRLARRR